MIEKVKALMQRFCAMYKYIVCDNPNALIPLDYDKALELWESTNVQ